MKKILYNALLIVMTFALLLGVVGLRYINTQDLPENESNDYLVELIEIDKAQHELVFTGLGVYSKSEYQYSLELKGIDNEITNTNDNDVKRELLLYKESLVTKWNNRLLYLDLQRQRELIYSKILEVE